VHPLDGLSWQLLPALADADLVHLFHPETRLGEVGLLLARLRRIPVCVTRYGEPSSKLFAELELLDLAEHVFGLQASAAEAAAVYQRLTGDVRRAAA
jgi:hypothetical protein